MYEYILRKHKLRKALFGGYALNNDDNDSYPTMPAHAQRLSCKDFLQSALSLKNKQTALRLLFNLQHHKTLPTLSANASLTYPV